MRALAHAIPTIALPTLLAAQQAERETPYEPFVAPASAEAERAMAKFALAPGLEVALFAAEPLLANPVSFDIDERGDVYVAETFRHHQGVTDNRSQTHHAGWLDDELACRTVADRVAMYAKHLGDEFAGYSVEQERIRWLRDDDGDGRADRARVFADGFDDPADGIAAGLLVDRGEVWYTCIPRLWHFTDTDHDGAADTRTALHDGFGVHTALLGHDMHGLIFGPDGRLYFSIGDRGLNVTTPQGRHLFLPDTGAVLRCERDGSNLEIFATGLRNPQELAFDDFGNLFTGDNNSDGGDRARWVYLVEGGDSGWQIGFQSMPTRGPWNEERLWHPHFHEQAAWIVPPIANLADGPSGVAYDTGGGGLPARFANHFFLCDFRGSSGNSGIHAIEVAPHGAGFEVTSFDKLIWNVLATDVDFGADGALYLTDWTEGWNTTGKGRIYRVGASAGNRGLAEQTRTLLASAVEERPIAALCTLLGHADRRVRQRAQFALAARGAAAALLERARVADDRRTRVHAIWALGQIARKGPGDVVTPLRELLDDGDGEIRTQVAKVLGEAGCRDAGPRLEQLLGDRSSRVRFAAAVALGKLERTEAVPALLELLRANADEDPFLRHAASMALAHAASGERLLECRSDPAAAVRLGAVLALRRQQAPAVEHFLSDAAPRVVLEAARAIHDVPIEAGYPALADLLLRDLQEAPLARRALNAAFHLGGADQARRLAGFAARAHAPPAMRREALDALADWTAPSGRDRVLGRWRPLAPRSSAAATAALAPRLDTLLAARGDDLAATTVAAMTRLDMRGEAARLVALVEDTTAPEAARARALIGLERFEHPDLAAFARRRGVDESSAVRREAFRILARLRPAEVLPICEKVAAVAPIDEQRQVLSILAELEHPAADEILATWLDRLLAGDVPAEVRLDLVEAAERRNSAALDARLASYRAAQPADDPLAAHLDSLVGGDRSAGSRIFWENASTNCRRCHSLHKSGGEAGPPLDGVGKRLDRRALLEALVEPSRTIAAGYGTVAVTLRDGSFQAGVLRGEDESELRLQPGDGDEVVLPQADITERTTPVSAMPPVGAVLSPRELRDLVEYLSSLK